MTSSPRSRVATRARLLEAARKRFQASGFDATTVRDIAADAGVDPALIMRYFGSKEGLFTEITLADRSVFEYLDGDRGTLGHRIASTIFTKEPSPGIETVLRSLGNANASSRYETELHERFVEPLAEWLGGAEALTRAGLIVSLLNGVELSITVLKQRSLTRASPAVIERHLGAALQALLDPP